MQTNHILNEYQTSKENWPSRESVYFYVFYIVSLWRCIVHWCKETHLIYGEGRFISLLFITFVLSKPLLCSFAAELISNILYKWYLEWLFFEPVHFGDIMCKSHWKSQFSNTTQKVRSWKSCGRSLMKRFPLPLWQEIYFPCIGEDTKFCFEWLITCPQTRKKGVKRLVRRRNASILEQTLWKQTDQISLIFNRSETVKSYISTSQ